MNNAAELTFPLIGFTYGTRTDIARRVLTNKDAALLILAANGGVMRVRDVKALLRGWRPFGDGSSKNHAKYYPTSELHFSYLFNTYYGHITMDYDRCGPRTNWHGGSTSRYSSGAYMWRPFKNRVAISALGRARLNALAAQAAAAGVSLATEVLEAAAEVA